MEYRYSGELSVLNLVIWLLIIIIYNSVYFKCKNKKTNYFILFLLVSLFCTFAFSEADTYHYHAIYDRMLLFNECIHVEPFYYWLIQILPHNYYIWRFVVWSMALLLILGCCRRYYLEPYTVSYVFPLILLQQFAVTRGVLGITLFLYALSFIFNPIRNRYISYLIAIIGCMVSMVLHRSLPLFAAILLLSFFPFNKRTVSALIILFPILRFFALPFVFEVLGANIFSEQTIEFTTNYLESEQSKANANGIIRLIIDYIPRFLIFYVLIEEYVYKNATMSKPMKIMFRYSFILFYIALLFLGQETSSFVTNRTLHMMCFPLLLVLSYYLYQVERTRLSKFAMFSFVVSDLFSFSYMIYSCW